MRFAAAMRSTTIASLFVIVVFGVPSLAICRSGQARHHSGLVGIRYLHDYPH
jgi:hypothetical protein